MATVRQMATQAREESSIFESLLQGPARFDADAYHVMQQRDEQLIRDNVLHGTIIKEYVYEFSINGSKVTGISVVGARQLACEYKGIKSRLVGSTEKTGAMFVFRSFEPMAVSVQHIPELSDEPDFYEAILEVSDIKTGNSVQVRKKENKEETKRNGDKYNRPHYDVIAESKAYRNGVLSIIPQSVIAEFEQKSLSAGNGSRQKTLQEIKDGITREASKLGIVINRDSLASITYGETTLIGEAFKEGQDKFKESLIGYGLVDEKVNQQTGEITND